MALFATSLNLLVGNTGMVSFGHGMFYGLGAYIFALTMQMTSLSLPVAAVLAVLATTFVALCVGAICVRLSHRLFRLHHARGADAVLQHHHLLAEPDRRRPGPARRHSAPRDLRLRARLAASSLSVLRGRGGARPAGAAPHLDEPVRPDAAHDPRQRGPRQLPRRRAVAGPALGLHHRRRLRGTRRRAGRVVRLRRLSRTRGLAEFRPGDLCRHARRHQQLPRAACWAPRSCSR